LTSGYNGRMGKQQKPPPKNVLKLIADAMARKRAAQSAAKKATLAKRLRTRKGHR